MAKTMGYQGGLFTEPQDRQQQRESVLASM